MPSIEPIRPRFNLEVLSAEQLAEIKSATLHILEHVGVKFPSERALRVFAEHGANVDVDKQIVRMPSDLVLEGMSRAPRAYTLSGRAEGTDLVLDGTAKVGPRGHFLAQKHTRRHVRDVWIPALSHPRQPMDGGPLPDIRRRARAELDRILVSHQPEPLEEVAQAELKAILDDAAQES